jgi:CubicO group peptidase (beta-lactamase class C family)
MSRVCGPVHCVVAVVITLLLLSPARAEGDRVRALQERMQAFTDEGQIAGVVGLVFGEGKPLSIALGYSDLENKTPMSKDTLFGIMSMTKPITATAVLILADEGKLSIDDPVE